MIKNENKSIFAFSDYKKFLLWKIESSAKGGRGIRAALSEFISVQSAYLSRVLNGDADLSLEQADTANLFLGHSRDESRYFLLLVAKARAGTASLKGHFESEIRQLLENRDRVVMDLNAIAKKVLSLEDQLTYYSDWRYSAIHIALSIPEFQTKKALCNELKLSFDETQRILEFLVSTGMAFEQNGKYKIGKTWIHLPADSPLVAKHHSNWRYRAIPSSEKMSRNNFHYTQIVSLSKADSKRLLEMLSNTVERVNEIVRPSNEEELRCISIDFFSPAV